MRSQMIMATNNYASKLCYVRMFNQMFRMYDF